MSYREAISIDRLKLDDILEENPSKFMEWGEQWIAVKEARDVIADKLKLAKDKYKENLEYVKAELFEELRINWAKYDFDKKPTDKQTENWIIVQEEYQKAVKDNKKIKKLQFQLIRADRNCNRLKLVIEAFEQKKYNMGNLVQLHHDLYWNVPTTKEAKRRLKEIDGFVEQNSRINRKMKEKENNVHGN